MDLQRIDLVDQPSRCRGRSRGDLDNDRNFVAIGLWDPGSPIRIRVLHHGKPATIDTAFWQQRVAAAVERRAAFGADTDGYRILNGENDGFPGLILDRYADTFVLKMYSPVWIPHLKQLVHVIGEQFDPTAIVLRLARTMADQRLFGPSEGMALIGEAPTSPVLFHENGLVFEAESSMAKDWPLPRHARTVHWSAG